MQKLAAVAAILAIALIPAGAAAASRRHVVAARSHGRTTVLPTRTIIRHPDGTVTIIVTPHRSYLDPGTVAIPGAEKSTDYVMPPSGDPGRPNWFYGPDVGGAGGYPLPRPFYLPGYDPAKPF